MDIRGQHPFAPGEVVSDVLAAIARWNSVADSRLQLSLGRLLPRARCEETRALGRITISFGDPCNVILDGTPAIGGFSQPDVFVTREIGGSLFARIVDGYVMFDDGKVSTRFIASHRACFRDVLIHELGHALGLDHSGESGSVMKIPVDAIGPDNPCRSGQVRDLGADDRAAIRFLYTAAGASP